jgi:hypothetical protein
MYRSLVNVAETYGSAMSCRLKLVFLAAREAEVLALTMCCFVLPIMRDLVMSGWNNGSALIPCHEA